MSPRMALSRLSPEERILLREGPHHGLAVVENAEIKLAKTRLFDMAAIDSGASGNSPVLALNSAFSDSFLD